jgi:hypothetical protein
MRRCTMLAAFLGLALCAGAQTIDGFDRLWSRDRAMGGPHVALADDSSVIVTNPAGLAVAPRKLALAELGLRASGPLFDIADAVLGNESEIAVAIANLLRINDYKLYGGLAVDGPLAFSFVGGGLGFGIFNRTQFVVNASSISSIKVIAREDILLAAGYAFRVDLSKSQALDFGVGAKGFIRGEIAPTFGAIEIAEILDNPSSVFEKDFFLTTGVGIDIGMRWSLNDRIAAALVCRDLYSPAVVTQYESFMGFLEDPTSAKVAVEFSSLLPELDVGFLWAPSLGRLGTVIDAVNLCLDYGDILDLFAPIPRNPILNLRLGAEMQVLEIVTFRIGIKDALLNAGIGMDLGIFKLNMCAFGSELGLDPGDRVVYNLKVSFDFVY